MNDGLRDETTPDEQALVRIMFDLVHFSHVSLDDVN